MDHCKYDKENKPHFITTFLVVTLHESKCHACNVFASQAGHASCATHVRMGPCPCDQLNARDADME